MMNPLDREKKKPLKSVSPFPDLSNMPLDPFADLPDLFDSFADLPDSSSDLSDGGDCGGGE